MPPPRSLSPAECKKVPCFIRVGTLRFAHPTTHWPDRPASRTCRTITRPNLGNRRAVTRRSTSPTDIFAAQKRVFLQLR